MFEIADRWNRADSSERADELFCQHQQQVYRETDQLFAKLIALQWVACLLIAVMSGSSAGANFKGISVHLWTAIFLGGAITALPVWLTFTFPGAAITRHTVAAAQMLMSALLIGFTGGRIETHFHIFGSLVVLSFYRDWRVLIPATIVVALDHFVRGAYWPELIYGSAGASPMRSLEHVGWVIFEDVFLIISCMRSVTEMHFIANRTAALEANERESRLIFEKAPIGMAVVGLNHQFQKANTALCEMVGYDAKELEARTPFDITFSGDLEFSQHSADEMLGGKSRSMIEKRYVRKNGEVIWAARTACAIRDEAGKPHHFLLMIEDISDRKNAEVELHERKQQLEAALEAMREAKDDADRANHAKSEFLSRMSHELRTPLNAILGFGQLLERQNPTDSQRTRVRYIISAGRHLLNLINEVLDISRIEAGNLQLSLEPVSVGEILTETLDLMRPMAGDRKIELIVQTSVDSSCYVQADRQRLKQVLLNFFTNAVKYTQEGGKVSVSDDFSGKESLRIVVTDNGPGIPVEKLSRLFTPFDRLGAEQSGVEGCGLGLALCQRLVYAMGGSVGAKSAPGKGSTFWVEMPLTQSPLDRLADQMGVGERPRLEEDEQRKLLYIEDNLSNLTLIEQMLADEPGYQLITAMQGQMGIDLARQHRPDLILLDLHLPDIPGWEVLARLQKDESTRDIPVIVISADATSRQIERLMKAGARAYLTKPLDMGEFYRVVSETKAEHKSEECVAA